MFQETGSEGYSNRDGGGRRVRHVRPKPAEAASESAPGANAGANGGPGRKRRRRSRNTGNGPNRQEAQPTERVAQPPRPHGNGHHKKHERSNRRVRRVRPEHHEEGALEAIGQAENWWANRWLAVLHRFGWRGRILNGKRYAEEGRVVAFALESGRIRARVQGSRLDPYEVTIALKPLPDMDWDLIVDIMSCQALFTAQLLAGEMPQDVEEVFTAAQASLFPAYKDDITAKCSCPDAANPCKHIAAVYYKMAEAFDQDPFLIFHLRGRSREALLGMLRAQRAAEAQSMAVTVETMESGGTESLRYWQAGEELEAVHIAIAPPQLPGGNARRLGRPPFWRSPADPVTRLADIYEAIARRAREVALNEPLVAVEV